MKKLISLVLFIALALTTLSLMSSCKTRKVSLSKVDSNTSIKSQTQAEKHSVSTDSSKTSSSTSIKRTDSSTYEIIVDVDSGKSISIKDGAYTGPAKRITIKGRSQTQKTIDNSQLKQNSIARFTDSTFNNHSEIKQEVSKKDKQVESKANFTWILYVAIGLAIILIVIITYLKHNGKF